MAKQLFGRNGQPAGTSSGGGGNANVYITIPNVDIKEILLIGTQAVVRVSASTFDIDNRVVFFDLRVGNTQMLLDAVKDGKMWTAEYTFTVTGQSGDRLAIFCNAIDQNNLRSMTGTPAISPRLTQSRIAAPVITSPTQDEYKTAGSIVIKGTEFVSLGASDTHKAVHGRVVLADDPQVVRWEGSMPGALTQITASWTPAGDGQEDLLCSLAYEGYSGGMGEWSEPVLVKLVKSGVSVPVITWPLNGEKYADPNLLRVNAEQPTVKSGSWIGTEWQVTEYADFSILTSVKSIPDSDIKPNRVMADITLDGRTELGLYLRCRHNSDLGYTDWSDVIHITTAAHQTWWEFETTSSFTAPATGIYEVLCVGKGGASGISGTTNSSGGGGGGYLAIGAIHLEQTKTTIVTMDVTSTRVGTVVALSGGIGGVSSAAYVGGNGGDGSSGGGGGGTGYNPGSAGGRGGSTTSGSSGSNNGGSGGRGAGVNDGSGSGGNGGGRGDIGIGGSGYGGGRGGLAAAAGGSIGSGGGGGGGGYGGGKGFDINPYFSSHLPFKNFNHITTGTGYVRIMYKGPNGEGA